MLFLISFLFFQPHIMAADATEQWAKKVIELRAQVELLNDEYKAQKDEAQNQIKSLTLQKAEIESGLRNEKIKNQQLESKIKSLKKSLADDSSESQELTPIVQKSIHELKTYIKDSLPFKTDDRLKSLESIEERLAKKEISAVKASDQVWAMIEDEKRLTRETSLHKQTILRDGKSQLAEVAKVGMSFLYYKTTEGGCGMAKKIDGSWKFISFHSEEKNQQVHVFMDSLKKQIRQGFFQLPTRI